MFHHFDLGYFFKLWVAREDELLVILRDLVVGEDLVKDRVELDEVLLAMRDHLSRLLRAYISGNEGVLLPPELLHAVQKFLVLLLSPRNL